jgi:hypothetical protein
MGVVGFSLALAAHLAAGGSAPGPAALVLLAGLIGLAAVLLTGARLSPIRVGTSLSAMQVILHEVLMWLGAPTDCLTAEVSAHGGMQAGSGSQPVLECSTGMSHAGMDPGSLLAATIMVGAHIAATAVMAALLAHGERALWLLAACVGQARPLRTSLPELPAVRVMTSATPRMLRAQFDCGGAGRRGPPMRSPLAAG